MLSGLKILDFTALLPGPFATRILADLGADILKIENPNSQDILNLQNPKINGFSANYLAINRNKRILRLDLRNKNSVEYIYNLISEFDIIYEGFRPGVMEKFGLGFETLKKINPKLIYVSLSGYGQTGEWAKNAGHDINYLALASIPSFGSLHPNLDGIQIADIAGGSLHAVIAILSSVIARSNSGNGQHIDLSMFDCTLSLTELRAIQYLQTNTEPHSADGLLNGGSFYDFFKTKDGRYYSVGALEPKFLKNLLGVFEIEMPPINPLDIMANKTALEKLKKILRERFMSYSFDDIRTMFMGVDACVEPVLTMSETFNSKHVKEREIVISTKGDLSVKQVAHPIKYSNFSPTYKSPVIIDESDI